MNDIIEITPELLRTMPLPRLSQHSDKDERGQVLIIGGGAQVPGASLLAGLSALRSGAGKLQMAASEDVAVELGLAVPEARILRAPVNQEGEITAKTATILRAEILASDAVVVGPGMMDEKEAGQLASEVLALRPKAVVLDAAAMTGIRLQREAQSLCDRAVMTPHAGELAKLLGQPIEDILRDPVASAQAAARRYGAVMVVKGADTHIATPDGPVFRNSGGVPGLGTSGSGDVLAGIIGGLLARGADLDVAAAWGVFVHAQCGAQLSQTIGPLGFVAREILLKIPPTFAAVDANI
jgi:ADP-dependent NAD(P)H-hydrate dehydratase